MMINGNLNNDRYSYDSSGKKVFIFYTQRYISY